VLDHGKLIAIDVPEAIRNSPDERIQNLVERRAEADVIDPHEYLERLTGEGRVR
jgi:phospholipid/cholesterol/gamma-HCH transport system ATP-binding protein